MTVPATIRIAAGSAKRIERWRPRPLRFPRQASRGKPVTGSKRCVSPSSDPLFWRARVVTDSTGQGVAPGHTIKQEGLSLLTTLHSSDLALLIEVLEKRSPDLVPFIRDGQIDQLSLERLDQMADEVTGELADQGFDDSLS